MANISHEIAERLDRWLARVDPEGGFVVDSRRVVVCISGAVTDGGEPCVLLETGEVQTLLSIADADRVAGDLHTAAAWAVREARERAEGMLKSSRRLK